MADANVNAPADQAPTMAPPIRTDDQILPHIRWVPIGKSNCYLDVEKKHKFHPRPDSLLHLPNEEPVLGYLKFSAKGTKREVFGMPIPGSLITTDIQGASYYQEYMAKVAKHQRYLACETESDPDSPAPKPTKTAKKPKPTAPKADLRPPVLKPASSKQLNPNPHQPRLRERSANIPEKEPRVDDEEADVQRALEESLKSMYDVPRGPLPPLVIREPESEKYQPLLEVSGNGKEKVTEEQVASEGQAGPNPDAQDEGQAGSNPDEQAEGQAGPNPGYAEASQPLPSPIVHAGSDLEHMDLDVQENLKLTVKEQVILEEPASSSGTFSSLQHLTKDLSFGDLFFSDKPSKADNDKAIIETEAESMVSVTIQQDTSLIPPMIKPIIDLTSRPESLKVHQLLKATATETTTTTIHLPPFQQQQTTTDSMLMKHIDELEHIMANFIQDNKQLEQRLDSHGARMYTLEHLDIPHQVSKAVDEVVKDAVD
nr:histone deacetylase 14 [Tanacetum cinerariifolium]